MRVAAVVQARLSSRRLPGKALKMIGSRPVIGSLLEGLRRCTRLDTIVVATSTDPSDDALVTFADAAQTECFRGSLENVAERLLRAAERAGADAIVRLSGDSPLLDPALVDTAVELFLQRPVDLVTNVWPRSFPRGQSVEVIASTAMKTVLPLMGTGFEREHVTPYYYSHAEQYSIRNFSAERPRPEVQLSVDSAVDLARCTAVLTAMRRPHWEAGWEECVRTYDELSAAGEGDCGA